jgi:hypothetical protein
MGKMLYVGLSIAGSVTTKSKKWIIRICRFCRDIPVRVVKYCRVSGPELAPGISGWLIGLLNRLVL